MPTIYYVNAICAFCGVHSKSVNALVTRALATIIIDYRVELLYNLCHYIPWEAGCPSKDLGCVLDCYSGNQLPAVLGTMYM